MEVCISIIVGVITAIGVIIAVIQLVLQRREIRRSYSPIPLVEFNSQGASNPINLSRYSNIPVVQNIRFAVRNDGNGAALNMRIEVSQGELVLERSVDSTWASRGISVQELYRNSLARGEHLECCFSINAGYIPPQRENPLRIIISCENIYKECFRFIFEAPLDFLSAIGERYRSLTFIRLEEC